MSLSPTLRLIAISFTLVLFALLPVAQADEDAPTPPRDPRETADDTRSLRFFDVRDLELTEEDIAAIPGPDGAPVPIDRLTLRGGVLVVRGPTTTLRAAEMWLDAKRAKDPRRGKEDEAALHPDDPPLIDPREPTDDAARLAGLKSEAQVRIGALKNRIRGLERQRAELTTRMNLLAERHSTLAEGNTDAREALDTEVKRLVEALAELGRATEQVAGQKARLEADTRAEDWPRVRAALERLRAEDREREASRSARWPAAAPGKTPRGVSALEPAELEVRLRTLREAEALFQELGHHDQARATAQHVAEMERLLALRHMEADRARADEDAPSQRALLHEVRALRSEVREVKAILLRLLGPGSAPTAPAPDTGSGR